MKGACVLLLTIGWAVLIPGMDYAATSDPLDQAASPGAFATRESDPPGANSQGSVDSAQDQKNGEHSDKHRDSHRSFGKSLVRGQGTSAKAKRPIPLPSDRVRSGSATVINLPQSGSSRSSGAEVKGSAQNGTVKGAVSVRPPTAVRPAQPPLSNTRHRSPNPAVIGGQVNSKTGNTGVVSGTHMERRH